MKREKLLELLEKYNPNEYGEIEFKKQIMDFVSRNDIFLGKGNPDGHVTASSWVVSLDRSKVLMTLHRKLNRWLQLGGHTEIDEDVSVGAFREAVEESGLSSIKFISCGIFDIDVHKIPGRMKEKEHFHYDIRFIFEADENEEIVVSSESNDVKWVELSKIKDYTKEKAIIRMAEKTLMFQK